MRLELVLIVGILFFCSWCAYIVARMNSSVGADPAGSAPTERQTPSGAQESPHPRPPNAFQAPSNATARAGVVEPQNLAQHLTGHGAPLTRYGPADTPHQFQATSQATSAVWLPPVGRPTEAAQAARAAPPLQQRAPPPAHHPPEATVTPTDVTPAPPFGPALELMTDSAQDYDDSRRAPYGDSDPAASVDYVADSQEDAPDEPAALGDADADADASEPEDEEEEGEAGYEGTDGAAAGEAGPESSGEEGAEALSMSLPRPRTELNEVAQRRSFSELDEDTNERDKSGHLVATRRRHLINGRPVRGRRASSRAPDFNQAARRSAAVSPEAPSMAHLGGRRDEFERLVEEIDREDKLSKRRERAEGRAAAKKELNAPRAPRQRPAQESHRLRESLTQRQWDDDSSSSANERPEGRGAPADEEKVVASVVERDAEAQSLERQARELARDPNFAELTRRRRHALEPGAVESSARRAPPDESESLSAPGADSTHQVADQLRWRANQTIGGTPPQAPQLVRSVFNGHAAAHDGAADPVGGLEDMQVEILAQPPPPSAPAASGDTGPPALSQAVAQAPWAGRTPLANSSSLSQFPRVASPFASGSAAEASMKRKRKKKKAEVDSHAMKRSQSAASKYKAAEAYAKKRASKLKKGQMRKKRRNSQKRLNAAKKHFAGSTRGLKLARGRVLKGADGGATYLKDKGYKKRGFKKAYHKLETGDHKTYFDEFHDKDHKKKWKNFDDKHKYSQSKKWAGKDRRLAQHHDLKEARGRASKAGQWRESERRKWAKEANKYKKEASARRAKMGRRSKRKKKEKEAEGVEPSGKVGE